MGARDTDSSDYQAPGLVGLLGLAWPIVAQRAAQVVVGLADALMVKHLGEQALAATMTGSTNAFAVFILPMGVVFVVASFSSQLQGRADYSGARRYGWYGLLVAAGAGVLCAASLPLVGPALGLLDFQPDVLPLLRDYLGVRLLAGGFVVGLEALGNFYAGLGNTRLPMAAQLVAMGSNVGLNWLLIDGRLGLPGLGVTGAALASVLATALGFTVLLGFFLARRGMIGGTLGRWSEPGAADSPARAGGADRSSEPGAAPRQCHAHSRADHARAQRALGAASTGLRLAEFGRLLRFGLPSGLNWFMEFAAYAFYLNVIVVGLGTTALAAFMIVMQLNSISFMPAFGLASAGAVFVGQAIGAGQRDAVPRVVGLTVASAAVWQGLVGLAYVLVPSLLLRPFLHEALPASDLLAVATLMLMLSAAWQLFDATATTLGEALRAAGDTAVVMWLRLVIAWLIFVPVAWLAVRTLDGGPTATLLALVAYLALLAGALLGRFASGAWRRIELVEPAP